MVIGPLLLELHVLPQVASATSTVMVLFSSSSAAVAFAATGRLNLEYAAIFGGVCLASALIGAPGGGLGAAGRRLACLPNPI